ncbi:UPF0175 family protein [Candidatus Woesearchaeota archaeon]|nr:UPF0175 family protein [Candidatus Woesearchaeota archaeon]
MESTISVRVPAGVRQELDIFVKEEKMVQTSEAARKLLLIGLEEWHKKKALNLLSKGRVTLSKAAQIAKVSIWEMIELAKGQGIRIARERKYLEQDLV